MNRKSFGLLCLYSEKARILVKYPVRNYSQRDSYIKKGLQEFMTHNSELVYCLWHNYIDFMLGVSVGLATWSMSQGIGFGVWWGLSNVEPVVGIV